MLFLLKALLLFYLFQAIASDEQDGNLFNDCQGILYSNLCVRLGPKRYLIDATSRLNWFEAERFCRRQNGTLANIESANELVLIFDYFRTKNLNLEHNWFWISGNDLGSEGKHYSISTGRLLPFTDFTKGQPDNAGGNEHCILLWKAGPHFGMNDCLCARECHFICELNTWTC